jgi:hypothetical protein
MLGRDVWKMQTAYEGGQGTHLSQAAEMDMSALQKGEDAKAEIV